MKTLAFFKISKGLFFKRIRRKLRQSLDLTFNAEHYAQLEIVTIEGDDYYVATQITYDEQPYVLLVCVDDPNTYIIHRSVWENGENYYEGLRDETEFYGVLARLVKYAYLTITDSNLENEEWFSSIADEIDILRIAMAHSTSEASNKAEDTDDAAQQ